MSPRPTAALALLTLAASLVGAPPARAQEVEVGAARIVTPSGDRLEEGGSATPFTLDLPSGAECPGDSADDGYRVNSYMVPASVLPTEVTYDGLGPAPQVHGRYDDFRQPLFDTTTSWFVSALTADAEPAGGPGLILDLPAFSLGVYAPGDLPPGHYRIGIACTLLNEITRVWDTELEVVADPGDQPAGIRWRAVGTATGGSDGGSAAAPLVLGATAGLGAAGALLYRHNRRRHRAAHAVPNREEA